MNPCEQEPEIKKIQTEVQSLHGVVSSMEQSHKELVVLLKKVTEQGVEIRHVLEQQAVLFKQLSFLRDERLPAIDAGFAGFKTDVNSRLSEHKIQAANEFAACKQDIETKISNLKAAPGKWIISIVQALIIAVVGAALVSLITAGPKPSTEGSLLELLRKQQQTLSGIEKALSK